MLPAAGRKPIEFLEIRQRYSFGDANFTRKIALSRGHVMAPALASENQGPQIQPPQSDGNPAIPITIDTTSTTNSFYQSSLNPKNDISRYCTTRKAIAGARTGGTARPSGGGTAIGQQTSINRSTKRRDSTSNTSGPDY
jgi:hypothetical protein